MNCKDLVNHNILPSPLSLLFLFVSLVRLPIVLYLTDRFLLLRFSNDLAWQSSLHDNASSIRFPLINHPYPSHLYYITPCVSPDSDRCA